MPKRRPSRARRRPAIPRCATAAVHERRRRPAELAEGDPTFEGACRPDVKRRTFVPCHDGSDDTPYDDCVLCLELHHARHNGRSGHFLGAVEIPWSELLERDESKTHHKLLRRERLSEAARAIGPKEGISQSMIQGMLGFKAWVAGRPA